MRAILLSVLGLTIGCTSMAGCTSSRWAWQSPLVAKSKSAPASSEPSDKAGDTKTADATAKPDSKDSTKSATPANTASTNSATDSPFKSSRMTDSNSAPPVAPEKKEIAGGSDDPGGFGKPAMEKSVSEMSDNKLASGSLTPETLLLINQELQDATAAERQEWYEQLKKVDPSLIPDILRVRRMSLQASTNSPSMPTEAQRLAAAGPQHVPQPEALNRAPANSVSMTPPAANAIVPAGYQGAVNEQTLLTAGYTHDPSQHEPIEHAVYREDLSATGSNRPIVLQNHEFTPPAGTSSGPTTSGPQRLTPAPQAQPAGVSWPPTRVEAPPAPPSGLGNVATGFVQNVVNLVPGRNGQATTANLPAASPNIPPGTNDASQDWRTALEQTIGLLEQRLSAMPPATTPEAKQELLKLHTSLRMLYLIGNHQERALTAIPGIEPAEQEFWQQLMWGTMNALDVEHMPLAKDRATQTMAQLNSAIRRLQEQADLQVRHVTFCQQIVGFGNYEKLARSEFSPGQEVLMYADIDNFKSDPTADGQYRTLLRSTIELMSPSGEIRKRIDFPATEDTCSTYRRDYFHNYQFRIPERMPLGPHVLKLTVFDELSGKMNSYSLNFVVK